MTKDKGHLVVANNPSDDIAIRVEHVSKSFRLPHNRQNSIKGSLVNLISRGDRTFETQEVLKDISFEIKKGEFFGIVGRNGSGKSTLLKMLAGIYTPTKGKIIINGSLTPFIELGVGFNPELTGRENVYLNGALLGYNNTEMDTMYDDIVSFAELERFMDQKLKNYSSGMQVRLAFSIAIRAKTDILLIDEVLAVGDAAFQTKCFDYFHNLKKSDTTVIFVSHDRGALERFCSRGVLIDNGRMITIGPIKKVLAAYSPIVLAQMTKADITDGNEGDQPLPTREISLNKVSLIGSGGVSTKKLIFNDHARSEVEVRFHTDVEDPIVGITLWKQNVEHAIFAVNNLTEGLGSLGIIRAGACVQYAVDLPAGLNDGEYIIEVAVANKAITHYYIQEQRALVFRVYGSNNPHALLAQKSNMQLSVK